MKNKQKIKSEKRLRRKARVRAKVFGTQKSPRLSVYRSLRHIYAQLIDDEKGRTLVSASDLELNHKIIKQVKNKKPAITEDSEKSIEDTEKKSQSSQKDSESLMMAGKVFIAREVGRLLAQKALDPAKNRVGKKIKKCVFDKGCYKYHGRVKAVADGAREGGLQF